jgi:hypothetical protein
MLTPKLQKNKNGDFVISGQSGYVNLEYVECCEFYL